MLNDRVLPNAGNTEQNGINYNLLAASEPDAPVYKPGQTTHEKFIIDGKERTADVHIPAGWDGKTPLPTLYYFKGLHPGGPEPESFTGLSQKSDKQQAIVVYLNGEGSSLNGWNNGQRWFGNGADENKYLNAVRQRLSKELPLDQRRQGLAGFSNGGSEIYILAAENNWISSVQSVEGYMTGYEPKLTRPISQQNIHALHDAIVPFGGTDQVCRQADREAENQIQAMQFTGEGYFDPVGLLHGWECDHETNGSMIQSQQFIVDAYNRANGLVDPKTGKAPPPVVTTDGDITTRRWLNPASGTEDREVILGSGGHGWAGSSDHQGDVDFHNLGVPNEEMSASDAILTFLKDHPLVQPDKPAAQSQER